MCGGTSRGAGRSSGCGGGGGSFWFFFCLPNDDDASSVAAPCVRARGAFAFAKSPGPLSDSVMSAECAGMFSDVRDAVGVSNGFSASESVSGSGVGGAEGANASPVGVFMSARGRAFGSASRSSVRRAWCAPTPPRDALRESRRKRPAMSEGAVLPPDVDATESRAAFRRCRSATSQRRKF